MTVNLCRLVFAQSVQKCLHCTTIILFLWYSYSQIKCLYFNVIVFPFRQFFHKSLKAWAKFIQLQTELPRCPQGQSRTCYQECGCHLVYTANIFHSTHYTLYNQLPFPYVLLFCLTDLAQCEVIWARLVCNKVVVKSLWILSTLLTRDTIPYILYHKSNGIIQQ